MTLLKYSLALFVSVIAGISCALLFHFFSPTTTIPDVGILETVGARKPIVLGFIPYWLLGKVSDESLEKLNTVTYFGLVISTDGTYVRESEPNESEPGFRTLEIGKYQERMSGFDTSSSLLLHLANEASISALLSEPELHAQNLVNDVEPLMKEYGFTDLNLDIESFREASPEARTRMTAFIREVKNQLVQKELGTLTTELTVSSLVKPHLFDPMEVGAISDYVVLMAYDFYYTGSYISGPVAPLGGAKDRYEYDVIEAVKLATQVIPKEKIILGIPLYGYEWETLRYEPGSPVVPGTGKTATSERVKELLANCTEECIKGRDEVSGTPYIILPPNETSAIQQIYYEDEQSIKKKLDLAKEYKLGGVGFWAMGYESEELLRPLAGYSSSLIWE